MYPRLFPRANRQDYEQANQQIYPRHIPPTRLLHQVLPNLQMVNRAVGEVIATAEYAVQMEKMALSASSQLFSAGGRWIDMGGANLTRFSEHEIVVNLTMGNNDGDNIGGSTFESVELVLVK